LYAHLDCKNAARLAEHVLDAVGKAAFVSAFVNECTRPLVNLGLLDAGISLSERALGMVEKESEEEAMVLGNLGLIYRRKGDLDKAEDMFLKILKIHEKLSDEGGKSKDDGNLGLIYRTKGDLDKAEDMHNKSLEIEKKLGRLEGMANQYGNLGLIYKDRGDLDKAEEMHKKALEIDKTIGRLEGQAIRYANLGLIYEQWGDISKTKEYWEKALGLYKKIGMTREVEEVQGWIEGLKDK